MCAKQYIIFTVGTISSECLTAYETLSTDIFTYVSMYVVNVLSETG